MGNGSPRPTCLGDNGKDLVTYEHGNRIQDILLHYFGCLRISERASFFAQLPEHFQQPIAEEERRIQWLRLALETSKNPEVRSVLKALKHGVKDWKRPDHRLHRRDDQHSSQGNEANSSEDQNIRAGVMSFKNGKPFNIPGLDNDFPHQNITVEELLTEDPYSNPVMRPGEGNMVRYFHLPANNIIWVEELIARYHNERRPEDDGFSFDSNPVQMSKAQTILRPESWRGQQHGDGNAEVHARHMRPLFDAIPTTSGAADNLVLFMHYLHWETDRGRTRSANAIKEASKAQLPTMADVVEEVTANEHPVPEQIPVQTKTDPTINRRKSLAKMLFYAAKLSEFMDSYSDERLIHDYLHEDPPLHPRRTLDQSYYGDLKNTETRDRDQVVYRATTPQAHNCVRNEQDGKCTQCQDDIKMVPKVIMVDQLWMWVLDENTIITSFPQRLGRNGQDPSSVYKSIQKYVATAADGEVRSVYDLALIIIDQCSRVFFDRSRPFSESPKLVDIFADAIQGVTYKQTAAFDQFLTYTHLASKNYNSKDITGNLAMQNALLNINPEGNLLKEIKDILDELHIMMRIQLQQQAVATSFVDHIKHILQPKIAGPAHSWLDMLNEETTSDSGEAEPLQRHEFHNAKRTLTRADVLMRSVRDRISELKTLEETANKTSTALKDLLTLKQQQAGVIEAREALKQAMESLKQGKSIMLFTVITIIFLPLGFCASVFGMNTAEFNGGLLTLHEEFYYMFPISIAIIMTAILLAFFSSAFLSSLFTLIWVVLSYPINLGVTWVLTKSGMFTISRNLVGKAKQLKDRERKRTGMMMAEAMREKMDLKEKIEGWRDSGGEVVDGVRNGVSHGLTTTTRRGETESERKSSMKVDVESLSPGEV